MVQSRGKHFLFRSKCGVALAATAAHVKGGRTPLFYRPEPFLPAGKHISRRCDETVLIVLNSVGRFAAWVRTLLTRLAAGADVVHFDVMDNHYVPNLTIGPMVLKALRNYGITAPIDVHLMVKPVDCIALILLRRAPVSLPSTRKRLNTLTARCS